MKTFLTFAFGALLGASQGAAWHLHIKTAIALLVAAGAVQIAYLKLKDSDK